MTIDLEKKIRAILREKTEDFLEEAVSLLLTLFKERERERIEEVAKKIEEIIVDTGGLKKFPIGSVELHTTIGGNAGTRRAASILRSTKDELRTEI